MAGGKKISDRQVDLQKYVLKTLLTATLLDYALKTELFSGDYNDLSNLPNLFSGNYNDLSNKPDLSIYAQISQLFSGDYNDLSNLPNLFSGDYNDLSNTPNLQNFQTENDVLSLIGQNAFVGFKGSTDWFDPSSANGSIQAYANNGIINGMTYQLLNTDRSTVTLTTSQNISGKFVFLSMHTDQSNVALESNYTLPVIKVTGNNEIVIGFREIGGYVGKIRIELLFI